MSRTAAFALAAAVALTASVSARADSAYCASIQADYLTALRASGGKSDLGSLRRQLAAAQADARNNNCRRFLFFGRRPSRNCPSIMGNLYRLQRQVNHASGGWGMARQASFDRNRLYNELQRNGCSIPSLGQSAGSGYRTICVRSCDGYYFPISSSASRARFKVDEAVCQSMYGNANASLFVYPSGGSAQQAVTPTGVPLASQPYAFLYRSVFEPACRAELTTGLASLEAAFEARVTQGKATPLSLEQGGPGTALPAPVAQVNPNEDPETAANVAGGFTVAPVVPETSVASTTIRRLGPDYYYKTPDRIEALYRAPDPGPEFSLITAAHADERHDSGGTGSSPTAVQ